MWFVNATSCINGSKLFEAYDYETFGKIQRQYVELSSVEKAKYRGQNTMLPFRQVRN